MLVFSLNIEIVGNFCLNYASITNENTKKLRVFLSVIDQSFIWSLCIFYYIVFAFYLGGSTSFFVPPARCSVPLTQTRRECILFCLTRFFFPDKERKDMKDGGLNSYRIWSLVD